MEQRSLRLGDIVDDYCPRERRITNHVVVALVGDAVKQTRCSTCEAEHLYKGARMPRKRVAGDGSDSASSLAGGQLVHPRAASPEPAAQPESADTPEASEAAEASAPDSSEDARNGDEAPAHDDPAFDTWLAHRPLIRATLPKTEGELPPPRAIPEFTMHQRHPRSGRGFRPQQGWSGGNGSGGNHSRSGGEPDGNRAPGPGGGKPGRHRGGRHRRRR